MKDEFPILKPISVRWADMDSMGHVNNAKYFTYCESARMLYFNAIDLPSHKEADSHGPALVTATCNFLRQVHHPADLEVATRVSEVSRRSFTFEYALFRAENEELVADGTAVVVWIDYATGKAIPLPEGLTAAIARLEGTAP